MSKGNSKRPILALALMAPIGMEVLSGATRLSYLFVLIPEIPIWGLGALMVRELVHRKGLGGRSLLLLGLALGMAEEFLIQQTSLAPIPWIGPGAIQDRFLGVNWYWLLAMLGLESVWVVLAPVQLTELLFPDARDRPWLRTRGLLTTAALFFPGCFIAWYGWTHRARPMLFHAPAYQPPLAALAAGAAAILLLIAAALRVPAGRRLESATAPPVWAAALLALISGAGWMLVVHIATGAKPPLPFAAAMPVAAAWAAAAYFALDRWRRSRGWTDAHRLALTLGATLAILSGEWQGTWRLGDAIFRLAIGAIFLLLIAMLWRGKTGGQVDA
jgi:hypothetical protein